MRHYAKAAFLVGYALSVCSFTARADTLFEDFNTGITGRWDYVRADALDAPWTIQAPDAQGGLRVSKSADFDGSTASVPILAGLRTRFTLVGDFSVFVDFRLPIFPLSNRSGWNEAILNVETGATFFEVLRAADDALQSTVGFEGLTGGFGGVGDSTSQGRLGLTRQGLTMSAWIDRGSGSVLIGSQTSPAFLGPATVGIFLNQQPSSLRPSTALDARFDNLSITADSIVPEPVTLPLLMLSGLAILRRR